jgi:hypothetical protein
VAAEHEVLDGVALVGFGTLPVVVPSDGSGIGSTRTQDIASAVQSAAAVFR